MKPLLLLDLDSTLIKTYDFWQDFAKVFAKISGKSEKTYIKHYEDFTKGEGLLHRIDYDSMISDANIAKKTVRRAIKEQMSRKSYLFSDAKTLLKAVPKIQKQYDVAILTFGQRNYQRLKIEHTPEIASIPVFITQQLKKDYIKKHFMNRPRGILVDDKAGQELPTGWTEIHIDRKTVNCFQLPVEEKPGIIRITNLKDLLTYL